MATSKRVTKRTSKLRKAHSHIKASKTRKLRPEVESLLGVKPKATKRVEVPTPETFADAHEFGTTTFEKPPAIGEQVTTGTADKHTFNVNLDVEAIRQEVTSSLSPLEKAGCDLMYALEATDGLVTDVTNRLACVLKDAPAAHVLGHAARIKTGIPYVDALNERVSKLEQINTNLRVLASRIAV